MSSPGALPLATPSMFEQVGVPNYPTYFKTIDRLLKPGGLYVITDYVSAAGKGKAETQSLHRIDPAVIKAEVTAAGFVLDSESNAMMNPMDDLTKRSGQGSSQIMLKFRKR